MLWINEEIALRDALWTAMAFRDHNRPVPAGGFRYAEGRSTR